MDRAGAVACACGPTDDAAGWLRVGLGVVVSGQLMLLSLARNLADLDASESERVQVALLALTALGVALLGGELLDALRTAWGRRRASLEAMFALALAGGLGASLLGLATGGPVFFEVVTVVLCVHAVGARVKALAWSRAVARVRARDALPRVAHRLDGDAIRTVDALELVVGDIAVVHDGDRVPAGGAVVSGRAWVDSDAVDGARIPWWVGPGERVTGGVAVRAGTLRVAVDARGLLEVPRVRQALDGPGPEPVDGVAGRWAAVFAPLVALVAAVAGVGWTLHAGVVQGFSVASAVLLVACPCGFGLATPVASWAAAARLAERGVRVRRVGALETLASVREVLLDKTGTLTELAIRRPSPRADRTRQLLGAVQQWFDHPLARLLAAGGAGAPEVQDARPIPGGVAARVLDGGLWRELRVQPASGRSLALSLDGRPAGTVAVDERVTSGTRGMLADLASLGVRARILTGDRIDPALGVPCEASASPDRKAERVRAAQGPVAFVGDRPNDLPALAAADIAIAAPGASLLVREASDLALDDLAALPDAIRGARALRRRILGLLAGSLAGNVVGIAAAAAGLLHPVFAACVMAGTSLFVTLLAVPPEAS